MKRIFGDTFDFDKDGRMNDLERRAEYMAFLDEVRITKGIDTELKDMRADQLADLAAESGIDPSGFGY